MPNDFTFREVCKLLKGNDGKLLESADKFLTLGIILSPVTFGPQALPVLGLLKPKDELVKLGRELLRRIIDGKKPGYLGRAERMQAAYGLICLTAFFDTLDHMLPPDLRKRIALTSTDKSRFAEQGRRAENTRNGKGGVCQAEGPGMPDASLPLPHPALAFEEQIAHLEPMYKSMASGFGEFMKKLAVWEDADERGKASIRTIVEKLPGAALRCFEGQYIELAHTYPDFCVWSRLLEQKATQAKLKKVSRYTKQHALLLTQCKKKIDVGFQDVHKAVMAIPGHFQQVEAQNIVEGLKQHYEQRVQEPIIEDEYKAEEGKPALRFPRISEAFVPQSYKVLRHTSKDWHLEKEETWNDIAPRSDLGAFLLSYLSSPYSIETPLLILGHPGSGKSLLTKILCAKLVCDTYTPIRVPLRDVDVDSPIENQIEGEIARATGFRIASWAAFSGQFADRPLIIVLDGYDELLQASGQVFAGYLKQVQQFQKREAEQGRPVRVIVTSRVALIDKVTVPAGSTVIRLTEFNELQRNTWIRIWNTTNAGYFSSCSPPIEPFQLPREGQDGKQDKILSLACQPLLLLMLALYDSESNRLRNQKTLDRTVLYNSLLCRFVERERRRYVSDFDSRSESERQKMVDHEMCRLGVAAVGMYNRRQFHIRSSDLNQDLRYFGLERRMSVEKGRPASESELLLGSFFFIHKSKAGEKGEGDERKEGDTAFEFLHNTFGEFLTADFILRFAFQETEGLHELKKNPALQARYQKTLQDPAGLAKEWFACLMYAALFSRPVVLEMLREWCGHLLARKKRARKEFLDCLDDILRSQIGMVLHARDLPTMLSSNEAGHFADLPMLAHVAIYTLNLITFRAVLDTGEFLFDESIYRRAGERSDSDESETRPWDMLAYLWRSWFPLDSLNGLTAVLTGKRDGSKIILAARKTFQMSPSAERLETVLNVASTLADHTTAGLAGWLSSASGDREAALFVLAKERLESEGVHLDFEYIVRQLWLSLSGGEINTENVSRFVMTGLEQCFSGRHRNDLAVEFLHLVGSLVQRKLVSCRCERDIRHELLGGRGIHPGRLIDMHPGLLVEWLRLLRELGAQMWMDDFPRKGGLFEELFHGPMHPRRFMEMMEMRPDVAVEWLRLLREFGGERWVERFGKEELFEQFVHGPMHPRRFMEMMEMRPDVAVEWLRLLREFGGERWVEHFGKEELFEECSHGPMHPHRFMEMMEMRPDAAVEWLRLVREFGGERWVERFGREELFKEFPHGPMHPRRVMEMMEMRPDVAVEWLRLVREFGGERWVERFGMQGVFEEFFHGPMHPSRFVEMMRSRPDVALAWLQLIREFGSTDWPERIRKGFAESGVKLDITRVPLRYAKDIRWFAEMVHDEALLHQVQLLLS